MRNSILYAISTSLLAVGFGAFAADIEGRKGNVVVCHGDQAALLRVTEASAPNLETLVRSGRATWSPSVLDATTAYAMAEGLGFWRLLSPTALFEAVGTTSPAQVLTAVALRETGRAGWYWPWSVNHAGRGYYFVNKELAIEHVRSLLGKGETNFDVGLMQVNWRWNGARFTSLEDAFDPVTNIRVADSIFQEHIAETGSLVEGVGRYHSKTPSLKRRYIAGVASNMVELQTTSIHALAQICDQGRG